MNSIARAVSCYKLEGRPVMARRTSHTPVNDFQRWFEAALTRRGIGLRELVDAVETDYSHLWKIVRGNHEKYLTSKRPGYELTVKIGEVLNDVEGALVSAGYTKVDEVLPDSPRKEDENAPELIRVRNEEEAHIIHSYRGIKSPMNKDLFRRMADQIRETEKRNAIGGHTADELPDTDDGGNDGAGN